jgi:hypothetical protein
VTNARPPKFDYMFLIIFNISWYNSFMDKSDKRIILKTGRACEKSTVNNLMSTNPPFKVKGLFNIISEMVNQFWTEIKNQKIKILNMPVAYINSPYLFCKYMGLHELMFTSAKDRRWSDPREVEPILSMNVIKIAKVNRDIINAGILEVIIAGAGIEVKRRIRMEECVVKMVDYIKRWNFPLGHY